MCHKTERSLRFTQRLCAKVELSNIVLSYRASFCFTFVSRSHGEAYISHAAVKQHRARLKDQRPSL